MKRGKDAAGVDATAINVEINQRIALALAPIAFMMLGMPLAIRTSRRETSIGLCLSVALGALYYGGVLVSDALRYNPQFYPQYVVWIPPLLFQLFGGILNLGLDALFLAVLRTGAVGSAWGTLIAQTLVAIVAVFYLLRQDDTFVLRRTPLSAVRDEAGNILSIGLPAGLQSMLITLSNVLITAEINRFGPVTIAAFSVYFEVELLLFYPILSFGQATSVFVSQNLGARQDIRVRSGIRTILGIGTGSTVAVSAVCILLSELLFSAFSKDPDVIALGVSMVRITFPLYFIYVFLQVLGDALRAMQHSFGVMLIILLNIGLARVLIMYALLHAYGTVQALVAVYPITWFTAAVSMAVLYIAKTKNFNKGEDSYETQVV